MMHIREGESTDEFLSSASYISGTIVKNEEVVSFQKEVFMSDKSKDCFSEKISIGGGVVKLKSIDYIGKTSFIAEESEDGMS